MKDPALIVAIGPSRRLTLALVALHLCALVAAGLADLIWPYRLPLAAAIVVSLYLTIKPAAARSTATGRACRLRARADGGLDLWRDDGWQAIELLPDTRVLSWCALLRYREPGGRASEPRLILPDSLDRDTFRRLRVWLRYRATTPGHAGRRGDAGRLARPGQVGPTKA